MNRLTKASLFVIVLALASCGGSSDKTEKENPTSSRDEIRLKQYMVQGAKIYSTYCANCHQTDGKGLAALYPPLAGSDYLMEDFARAACIIKNGQAKEIVVNGVTYSQLMPGNPITNLEVAEVLTYVANSWGNEGGLMGVKDIDKWIDACEEE